MDENKVTVRSPEEYDALLEKAAEAAWRSHYNWPQQRAWPDQATAPAKWRRVAETVLSTVGITRPEPTLGAVACQAWGSDPIGTGGAARWEKVAAAVIDAYEGRASSRLPT